MKIKVNIEPEDKDFNVNFDFDVPDKEMTIAKQSIKVISAVASAIAQIKVNMAKGEEFISPDDYGVELPPEHEPEPPPESHSPLEEESQSDWMPPTEDYK